MSQEKGKNLDQLESQLTLKNHNPGCMWGILHHFQHNRWNNVVKKLPRTRLIGHGKHSTDQGRSRIKSSSRTSPDPVERKADVGSSSSHKSSMKSRIKALIIDQKRSSIRKPVDGPPRSSSDELCTSSSSSSPPRDHRPSEESCSSNGCELCDTILKVNFLKQNELGKQPIRDHTLLHGNSIYAVEPTKCDSIQESKLFMDALDLLNVREEVFLKILQDPKSSLANNQLQFRQSPNLRFGFNKSVSFAVTEKREFATSQEEDDDEKGEYGAEENEQESVKKNGDNNKTGIKGFKNIGARIKHVIRDKKKENNRIIKDAVQDKIPCDRSVSKNDGQIGTDFGQTSKKSFKRTTSFNDSFDRYNQLLEISINRDAKDHVSDRLRFKTGDADTKTHIRKSPAKLGRIFSLPDLRSYSSAQIDDSTSNSPLVASETAVVNEQKPVDLGLDSENQENLLDVRSYSSTQIDDSTSNSPLVASETIVVNEQKPVDLGLDNENQENLLDVTSYSSTQIDDSTSNSPLVASETTVVNEQKPVDLGLDNENQENLLDVTSYSSTQIDDSTSNSPLVASEIAVVNEQNLVDLGLDSENQENLLDVRSCSSTQIDNSTSNSPLVASETAVVNEQKPVDLGLDSENQENLLDVTSYSSTQIDDSTSNSPLVASETAMVNEQKPVDLGLDSEIQDNLLDVGEDFDELVILKKSESESSNILNVEHVLVSAPHSPDLDEGGDFVHEIEVCEDSNSSTIQQDLSYSEQDMIDIDTEESEIQEFYDDLMHTHKVDTKNLAEYNYVRDVLELSGFSRDAFLGKWQSAEHLLNPSVFEQVEGCLVGQSECEQMYANSDHALLFDMINEVLLGIHERSFSYWPTTLTSLSRLHRLPKGNRILEEVWAEIRWLLSWRPECDQAIDEAVSRDMAKDHGWMNLQLDAECVGLKLEDMIFDDLVDEIIEE